MLSRIATTKVCCGDRIPSPRPFSFSCTELTPLLGCRRLRARLLDLVGPSSGTRLFFIDSCGVLRAIGDLCSPDHFNYLGS